MGYRSWVNAEVVPAEGKFRRMMALLRMHGFVLEKDCGYQFLMDKEGHGTGLVVKDETLEGEDQEGSVYGFGKSLIVAFNDAVQRGLIKEFFLGRDGEDSDDEEYYKLENGVLCEWVELGVMAPYGQAEMVREKFTEIENTLIIPVSEEGA